MALRYLEYTYSYRYMKFKLLDIYILKSLLGTSYIVKNNNNPKI